MNRRDKVATAMACGLAGDVVRTFGEVRLRVFGTSMVPSIHPGDLVTVQRAGLSEISSGEIVLYSREGRMFVHRVAECGNNSDGPFLITRGDRLRQNDPPVSTAELLGRVTSIQRGNRADSTLPARAGSDRRIVACSVADFRSRDVSLCAAVRSLAMNAISPSVERRRAECQA